MPKSVVLVVVTVMLCACSAVRTTKEVNSALVGKSRADVEEYFGRQPDEGHGETSYVYSGRFVDSDDESVYENAVVVFSHFEPDTVWSVGFTSR